MTHKFPCRRRKKCKSSVDFPVFLRSHCCWPLWGKGGLTWHCKGFGPENVSIFCLWFIYCTWYETQPLTWAGWLLYSHPVFCTDIYKWGTEAFLLTIPSLALFSSSSKIKHEVYLYRFCQQRATVRAGWVTKPGLSKTHSCFNDCDSPLGKDLGVLVNNQLTWLSSHPQPSLKNYCDPYSLNPDLPFILLSPLQVFSKCFRPAGAAVVIPKHKEIANSVNC